MTRVRLTILHCSWTHSGMSLHPRYAPAVITSICLLEAYISRGCVNELGITCDVNVNKQKARFVHSAGLRVPSMYSSN